MQNEVTRKLHRANLQKHQAAKRRPIVSNDTGAFWCSQGKKSSGAGPASTASDFAFFALLARPLLGLLDLGVESAAVCGPPSGPAEDSAGSKKRKHESALLEGDQYSCTSCHYRILLLTRVGYTVPDPAFGLKKHVQQSTLVAKRTLINHTTCCVHQHIGRQGG